MKRLRYVAACSAIALALSSPAPAPAGLLKPQLIDAGTGGDAIAVGSSLAPRHAWIGLFQKTAATGDQRLYAAYASDGVFGRPFPIDRGNAVITAGLAGNDTGSAIAVWTEKVGADQVLFGRRLANGAAGPTEQISVAGQDARFDFGQASAPFDRATGMAMNHAGAAVLCYSDAAGNKSYAATLAPGANAWATVEETGACVDPQLDSRGDSLLGAGKDANNKFAAFELIGGQFRSEVIDPNVVPMDEFSVALGSSGTALAMGRDNNFNTLTYSKPDLGGSAPWTNVGPIEKDLIQSNANPEDPFAALNGAGDGIVVFRDNSNANPQGYFRVVSHGSPGAGGVLNKSMSRLRPAVDAAGDAFVAYHAGSLVSAFLSRFNASTPLTPLALAPGLEPYDAPSLTAIAVDPAGNSLDWIVHGMAPTQVYAVLGDFVAPTLSPSVSPRRPRHRRSVVLRSHAADDFASLRPSEVRWKLPRGARAKRRTGLTIRVSFRRHGSYLIRVTASDPGGNRATRAFTVRVR